MAGIRLTKSLVLLSYHHVQVFEKRWGTVSRMSSHPTSVMSSIKVSNLAQLENRRPRLSCETTRLLASFQNGNSGIATRSAAGRPYKRFWYEPRYLTRPRINRLSKAIALGRNVVEGVALYMFEKASRGWWLQSANDSFGPFEWVMSTAPPAPTKKMFPDTNVYNIVAVSFLPCFARLLGCAKNLCSWDAAVVKEMVNWLAFTDRKPKRHCQPPLVVDTDGSWSRLHFDTDSGQVKQLLVEAESDILKIKHDTAELHHWQYAHVAEPLGQNFRINEESKLAASGDCCIRDKVEDAFLSTSRLAQWFGNS